MVQTTNDLHKLKEDEQQFLDKPLKNILKEIKPEIKTAFGTVDYPSYFSFKFITPSKLNRNVKGRKLVSLYVHVKEPLDWNFNKRPKSQEYQWPQEELEKYGSLTVTRIKVIERIED